MKTGLAGRENGVRLKKKGIRNKITRSNDFEKEVKEISRKEAFKLRQFLILWVGTIDKDFQI